MRNSQRNLIKASEHYAIAECGGLARVSTPFEVTTKTKMGVGFDLYDGKRMKFSHRHKGGVKPFMVYSHRMVYYLHHGEIPKYVDHIDGDPLNNSISNLRGREPKY